MRPLKLSSAAASLAAVIARELGLDAEIAPGSRGVFDVTVDGDILFSKHRAHRFPEHAEIVAELRARILERQRQ